MPRMAELDGVLASVAQGLRLFTLLVLSEAFVGIEKAEAEMKAKPAEGKKDSQARRLQVHIANDTIADYNSPPPCKESSRALSILRGSHLIVVRSIRHRYRYF